MTRPSQVPLLLLWMPREQNADPRVIRALAQHVQQEYGANLALRNLRIPQNGCRLQLVGDWWPWRASDIQSDLAHFWAALWDENAG